MKLTRKKSINSISLVSLIYFLPATYKQGWLESNLGYFLIKTQTVCLHKVMHLIAIIINFYLKEWRKIYSFILLTKKKLTIKTRLSLCI